jgi:hypothetical protein
MCSGEKYTSRYCTVALPRVMFAMRFAATTYCLENLPVVGASQPPIAQAVEKTAYRNFFSPEGKLGVDERLQKWSIPRILGEVRPAGVVLMHCMPVKLAGAKTGVKSFRCIQCNRNLGYTSFPVLRRDGRTVYLSDRCRRCEAVLAGGDGVVEEALHLIWQEAWHRCRAKGRSPEFTLRFQEVKRLWVVQRGLCAMTGRSMDCRAKLDRERDGSQPSIDRIDSAGPYAIGNVHLVCWAINLMKNTLTVPAFLGWCSAVVANSNTAVDNQAA